MLAPLPERLRPKTIAEFVGQQHLIGEGKVLRKLIESGKYSLYHLKEVRRVST